MSPQQFIAARKDQNLAVVEGVHALKHAVRFKAEIVDAISPDTMKLMELVSKIAPAERGTIEQLVREVPKDEYDKSSTILIKTGVLSVAKRRKYNEEVILEAHETVVWLDNPKNHENVGAVIRLSAGLGVAAVVVTGDMDVWNPGVVRGAAGLHFALPVIKTNKQPSEFNKSVYAFDDGGRSMNTVHIKKNSIIVFGSERAGVSEQIKETAEAVVSIPMKEGVSSFNLATSVALGLSNIISDH